MSSKSDTLTIGVLLLPPAIQLLDLSPVDLLAMCSRTYLSECGFPAPLVNTGLSAVTIHYISPSGSGSYTPSTASASILATASTSDEAVQPGKLDILFIPGPPPDAVPDADMKAFMRGHAESENTEVMVICTGIFAAGHAGILHGKNVTAPRGLIPRCRKMFPKVEFDGARRWKADGRVWCSGGITNGQDMVAAYIQQRFSRPLANVVCALADVGDRKETYDSSMTADFGWFGWQIMCSVFAGIFRR